MKPPVRTILMAVGVGLIHGAAAAPDMNPGQWETTVRTEMAGMPMQIPPVTHRQCLREQDVVPQMDNAQHDCRVVDQRIDGNMVSWQVQCTGEGMQMDGNGRLTYAGDAYQGRIEIRTSGASMGSMTMVQHLEGRRLGDCN